MEWIRLQFDILRHLHEDRDYLYFLRPFQLVAGYPMNPRRALVKFVTIVRSILYIAYLASLTHKMYYVLYQPEDINYVSFVSGGITVFIGVLLLMLIFTIHYDEFRQLGDFLNNRLFARDRPLSSKTRERWYRWSNCLILVPQISTLLAALSTWITRQHMKKHMMLVVRGEPIGTEFDHFLYLNILYFPMVGFVLGSSIVNAMVVGFIGEMELLAICLGDVFKTVENQLIAQNALNDQSRYWSTLHEELRKCAKRHCEIFTMLPKLQRISSFVFLQHHIFSLGVVTVGCYMSLCGPALREVLVLNECPVSVVLLYFIFCYLVEKLQDMNRCIGDKLYATDWMMQLRYSRKFHREYRSEVLTIGLLIMRSQQRIRFTCGSINAVSMEKFTDFINLTYSIVMFLLNVM